MPNCPTLSAIASQSGLVTEKRTTIKTPHTAKNVHTLLCAGGFVPFFLDILRLALSPSADGPQDQVHQESSHNREPIKRKKGTGPRATVPGDVVARQHPHHTLFIDISSLYFKWMADKARGSCLLRPGPPPRARRPPRASCPRLRSSTSSPPSSLRPSYPTANVGRGIAKASRPSHRYRSGW
jgi:hypothetical protein